MAYSSSVPARGDGAVVLDCRPPLLPVSMDIGGMDLSAIWAPAVSAGAGVFPLEREQLFWVGGGGFAWFDMPGVGGLLHWWTREQMWKIELPTPAASPVPAVHGVESLSTQADVDVELCRVFQDVGTLPEMVTPIADPEGGGGAVLTPARYPVPVIPEPSVVMAETLVVTSPAGPTGGVQRFRGHRLGWWVGCQCFPTFPVVSTPVGSPLSRAAAVDQCLPWHGSLFGGSWRFAICLRLP